MGAASGTELLEDAVNVSLACAKTDHQPGGDLAIREPLSDQPQDIHLPCAQDGGACCEGGRLTGSDLALAFFVLDDA